MATHTDPDPPPACRLAQEPRANHSTLGDTMKERALGSRLHTPALGSLSQLPLPISLFVYNEFLATSSLYVVGTQ